jgi:hypothetical protein
MTEDFQKRTQNCEQRAIQQRQHKNKKQKIHTRKCYKNKYPLAQYSFENTLSSILQIAFLGT